MINLSLGRLELTLCIIKPHVLSVPNAVQEIRQRILENGFSILASKSRAITKQEAAHFYSEHSEKFFYNRLVTFMTSGPCCFYILAKDDAITNWRRLLGPTKVYQTQFSHPESVRGRFGLTDTRNAAHGSDSDSSATREIGVFFPELNPKELLDNFLKGANEKAPKRAL